MPRGVGKQEPAVLRASLVKSAQDRAKLKKRFGFIPLSVLKLARGALSKSMFIYQREMPIRHTTNYEQTREKHERLRAVGYKEKITASMRGIMGGMGSTIMPAELVEFFVKYYAKPGDVYIDPFFGQGVQMQVAVRYGLKYIGYDISDEFCKYVNGVKGKLEETGEAVLGQVELYHADSRYPDQVGEGVGDFCFTSPPYWDTEYYGPEPEQLGREDVGYDEFIESMYEVMKAWHPKFKRDAWVVVNVNDFRKGGKYYSYHADTIRLFERAGYLLYDTWIIDGLVGGLPKAFAVDFNLHRIAPRTHEYVLVFRLEPYKMSTGAGDGREFYKF